MTQIFSSALLSTCDSLLSKLGKFRCQLYSLKIAKQPADKSASLNDGSLLTRSQAASYLNLSSRYVRTLQQQGILPFSLQNGIWYASVADLEKAKELNPTLLKQKQKDSSGHDYSVKPFYSKSIKISPYLPGWAIVDFSFASLKNHFFIPSEKSQDEDFIDSCCKAFLQHLHQIKRLPDNILSHLAPH